MKTSTFSPSPFSFISTAPLRARYEQMAAMIMLFLELGQSQEMLRMSYKLARCVKLLIKLETHNQLLERKRAMLSHPSWRRWVLSGLGGMRALKRWDAAKLRADARIKERAAQPQRPVPRKSKWAQPSKAVLESERMKAHAQRCYKAAVHPQIFRDRSKVDRSGQFRLPPLPRGLQGPRELRIYTRHDIAEYDYNAMPFVETTGLGPATVWPVEFYAAFLAEADINLTPCHSGAQSEPARPREGEPKSSTPSIFRTSASHAICEANSTMCGMTKMITPISLRAAIPRKTYRDLFEDPV